MKNDTWVLDYYYYLSLLHLYNKWVHACALMYLVVIYLQRFDSNKQSFHVQIVRRILIQERPSSFPIHERTRRESVCSCDYKKFSWASNPSVVCWCLFYNGDS